MHEAAAAAIRKRVQQSGRGYRERWEPSLKAAILDFIAARRRSGASYATISKEVGVPFATIAEWAHDLRWSRSAKFQQVEVRDERPAALALVHPSGVRVEGADVATVAAILKALS